MDAPRFRARTVPEILDGAFQVLRARYHEMLLVGFIVSVPAFALTIVLPENTISLVSLVHGAGMIYGTAAMTLIASDAFLGRERTPLQALGASFSRFGSLLGASCMRNLMIAFGTVLLVVPGVIAAIVTFAVIPAVILEGATASESYERSRDLARDQWGRVLGTIALAYTLMYLAYFGVLFGLGFLIQLVGVDATSSTASLLAEIFMTAATPITASVVTLLYYDSRIRKEAFDVQMTAAGLDGEVPAPPRPAYF